MIAYDFASTSLEGLDALQVEVLVLPYFCDERPLRGAAGLVDWRLCGALSRKLMAGYLDGRIGDTALIISPGKLRVNGLLMVGLGSSKHFDRRIAGQSCATIAATLTRAQISTFGLALPGRSMGLISSFDAMQLWLEHAPVDGAAEEIVVVERPEEHRVLESLFDRLRRQAESPLR